MKKSITYSFKTKIEIIEDLEIDVVIYYTMSEYYPQTLETPEEPCEAEIESWVPFVSGFERECPDWLDKLLEKQSEDLAQKCEDDYSERCEDAYLEKHDI